MILFFPVLAWLGTEICWLILKSRRPLTRLIAYLVCTAAILTLGSWLIGIAYERYFETQYAERGHGKIGDAWASHIIFGTVQQVATGTLALLCVSWGRRALVRSRALWLQVIESGWEPLAGGRRALVRSRALRLLALVLYFLALPLACLSFLGMYEPIVGRSPIKVRPEAFTPVLALSSPSVDRFPVPAS